MGTLSISVTRLIRRFWRRAALTWVLVLLEGVAVVAIPLSIGRAIDGLLRSQLGGVYELAGLCAFILVAGAGRRLYDTRAYGAIYRTVANELVAHERRRQTSLSRISARSGLFGEFIDFLEGSIPGIIHQVIVLVGTLLIVAFIDLRVFLLCGLSAGVTAAVYGISHGRIFRLNAGGNDELERQIDVLESGSDREVGGHFKKLMAWRIKLSDLETLNFSVVWAVLAAVIVLTVVLVASTGETSVGKLASIVMYVFSFAETVMVFPLYFQQLVRLREIAERLSAEQIAG